MRMQPSSSRVDALAGRSRPWPPRWERNGRAYYQRHYGWPVIERKYLEMFERLQRESPAEVAARTTIDPLPGWLARRRRDLRASADVLLDVPKGQSSAGRGEG